VLLDADAQLAAAAAARARARRAPMFCLVLMPSIFAAILRLIICRHDLMMLSIRARRTLRARRLCLPLLLYAIIFAAFLDDDTPLII